MGYRNNNDGYTAILGSIFFIWLIFFIICGIRLSLFPENNYSPFIGYLFATLVFLLAVGAIYLIVIKIREINLIKERNKIKNTLCEHGIKGGKTLELCSLCKQEKEQEKQQYEIQKKEQDRKKVVKQKAFELRNEEIIRFTKVNLGSKEFLYKSTPNEFEDVIAEMYRKLGYDVKQTPYSNDKGKDIILKKDGKKYLVECKRYDFENTIGREALQKFFAAIIEEKAEKGFFVTTSDYKSTAIQYAKDIEKIELINGNKLILMMREIYPENYNSNLVKIKCGECGDIVEFTFKNNELSKSCKNGHSVQNDFDTEILSPKYLISNKYCVKCGKPMKLVNWKKKSFWGCSDYPKCRSYQRYITAN